MARPNSEQPTELELQILKVLWDAEPMTVRELRESLAAGGRKITSQVESLAVDGGSRSQLVYRTKRLSGDDHTPRISLTRIFVFAIALAAVFGGLSMIAVAQSDGDDATVGDSSNGKVAVWGDESHGLQCRIVPVSPLADAEKIDLSNPADRFESPDEITFAVEIKNVSDHPIRLKDVRYGESYGDSEGKRRTDHFAPHLFEFTFTDTDGNAVARTRRAFTISSHSMVLRNALVTEVDPSETLRFLLKPAQFERSMDYRLPPGEYQVQVQYRGPDQATREWAKTIPLPSQDADIWPHHVKSNVETFSIAAEGYREPDLVWGPEVDGLQAALEIRVPRNSGIPTRSPGVLPTTSLSPILHVRNVSDKSITFASETGRQGDRLQIKTASGVNLKVKDVWMSGWPIDVRWTLQPSEVAELDVLTPSLNQGLTQGDYSARYTIRFKSRQMKDKDGKQTFPTPGDYQSEIETGWTPFFLRDPAQPAVVDMSTKVEGRVIDADGKPIAGADISCTPYAGRKEFKAVYTESNADGYSVAEVESQLFKVHVGSSDERYDMIRGFGIRNGHAICPWEGDH